MVHPLSKARKPLPGVGTCKVRELVGLWILGLDSYCSVPSLAGIEGGFDIPEEKFEYDEDVKIVIFPEHLEIPRDGLEGLPDMVRDRVRLYFLSAQRALFWSRDYPTL